MDGRTSMTTLLIAVLTGAVGFALGRTTAPMTTHADPPPVIQSEPMPVNDIVEGTDNMQDIAGLAPAGEAMIAWKAPARWKSVKSPSAMRLATFEIPHAPGDAEDAELSVTQVGGDVDANIDRWVGQFDADGQKTAKRHTKTVHGMKVTFVEIEGAFSGGMGKTAGTQMGWALLGAIVETSPMPHFFKLTGPAKSVKAARGELEAMIDSITPK